MRNTRLYTPEVWEGLIDESKIKSKPVKKDLTEKVHLSSEFKGLRVPLDMEVMTSLGGNEYSKPKIPKMLLTSISEYVGKEEKDVDFMDLIQMYSSIVEIFDGNVGHNEIKRWTKANKPKRFGRVQYDLMKDYFDEKMP